jgi:hypothetical protein
MFGVRDERGAPLSKAIPLFVSVDGKLYSVNSAERSVSKTGESVVVLSID